MRGNIRCLLLATSRLGYAASGAGELAGAATSTSYLISLPGHLRHSRHLSFIPLLNLNHHHLSLMLRLSLFAYAKPLFGPVGPRSGLKAFPLRSFGSAARPRILEAIRNRPSNLFTKSSRGIVDSAVISRPSQTDAWRRYAIMTVC
jgi:hypothetical protein